MSVDLKSLIELQRFDREIAKLEKSKMEFPKKVSEMEATLLEKKGALTAAEGKLETLTKDINKSTVALEDNEAALATSHDRLNMVKTNREYDAILLEISERKEMIEKDRKKKQKFAARNESLETEIAEAKNEYENVVAELQPQIDDLKSKIGSIDDDIAKVEVKRNEVEPLVPELFLSEYNRIREKRKNGIALSVVNEGSRACSYCYQVLNARAQKAAHNTSKPIYCENCGSIIVWDNEPPVDEVISE
jgi:predicted  nucleic acid-binding Zn-ribbon protein